MTVPKRKLIEVALPLEAINRESAREKSIRHGHPSTLHLWWARRPLAACRAVLFAQLVDDPSAHPDRFPTEESRAAERERLFGIIERLVVWENSTNETVLKEAREEIWKSCDGKPPPILDPFAGGGSIPLEAQRLGLEAHASDLNPVAVLINKALIEIPPKFAGRPPVFPGAAAERLDWPGATGLAEDVRRYGRWMRDEAEKRIGKLYPVAKLPGGGTAPVIAWIWARTVRCPNPACGIEMPLVRSWWLGKKKGKEAYVVVRRDGEGNVVVKDGRVVFDIGHEVAKAPTKDDDGTVQRTGAVCAACGAAVPLAHIRSEGKAGRIGAQLMAIVAEGKRQRIYLPPDPEHEKAADIPRPDNVPDTELPEQALGFRVQGYGMTHHADLFTNRQLLALNDFASQVRDAYERVTEDCSNVDYAAAVSTYLALAVSRLTDLNNSLVTWSNSRDQARNLFARQAIPISWDFAEVNPFAGAAGDLAISTETASRSISRLPARGTGFTNQADAATVKSAGIVIATDPPYYDNIGYADLSDLFYVWLRHAALTFHSELLATVLTPKSKELVADPFRHSNPGDAQEFFEKGFIDVFGHLGNVANKNYPMTVFYAFKQSEDEVTEGVASTGWEVFLTGLLRAGWVVTGTWPMRSERGARSRAIESNALASSIVLACRPRKHAAAVIDRRELIAALRSELPGKLKELQQGSVAPVDLAQAAIGPGMAVFSRYARVDEPDGTPMRVRTALTLINQVLDEVLAEQEGDFDTDTRWSVKWFQTRGYDPGPYGEAETLATALNTSAAGLERAGIAIARAGKVRLLSPAELPADYDPRTDDRISVWEVVLHLAKRLNEQGMDSAAGLMAAAGERVDLDAAKELAYLLYSICEKRSWAQQALLFNSLGTSWSDLSTASRKVPSMSIRDGQGAFDYDDES